MGVNNKIKMGTMSFRQKIRAVVSLAVDVRDVNFHKKQEEGPAINDDGTKGVSGVMHCKSSKQKLKEQEKKKKKIQKQKLSNTNPTNT